MKAAQHTDSSDEQVQLVIKNLDDNSSIVFNTKNADRQYTQIGSQRTQSVWASYWSEVKQLEQQLWQAVQSNNLVKLKEILNNVSQFPVEINSESLDRWTALHYAAFQGFPEITQLLITKGANVQSKTSINRTSLHLSCIKGFHQVVKILLENGSDPDYQDDDLCTPLHYAAMYGFDKVVKIMLQTGKKPNLKLKNYQNLTAPDCALDTKTFDMFKNQKNLDSYGRTLVGDVIRQNARADYVNTFMDLGKKLSLEERKQQLVTPIKKAVSLDKQQPKRLARILQMRIQTMQQKQDKLGPKSFQIVDKLGQGSFGAVYLVHRKNNQKQLFAMKVIQKKKVFENNLTKYIFAQRNILTLMDNPFIVKINGAFQTKQKLFLILEYCPGGDLQRKILRQKRIDQKIVKIYAAQVLLALESLHKREIIFRDLKPANVVLDPEGHAKVTDFGLSKQTKDFSKSFCGSIAYMAPQVLFKKRHGFTLDWYLFGVFIYQLLDGYPPYYCLNRDKLFENIKHAKLQLPKAITEECEDILRKLLERDPSKRLGCNSDAKQIKQHPWFNDINWDDAYNKKLKPPPIKMKNHGGKSIQFEAGQQQQKGKLNGWSFFTP